VEQITKEQNYQRVSLIYSAVVSWTHHQCTNIFLNSFSNIWSRIIHH
jgi:hypothetical protein